jgi:hypothetical protein
MKTAGYQPDRGAGALSLQKQTICSSIEQKQIINIFAMKTCTKLGLAQSW